MLQIIIVLSKNVEECLIGSPSEVSDGSTDRVITTSNNNQNSVKNEIFFSTDVMTIAVKIT